jgi:hypothetical protein
MSGPATAALRQLACAALLLAAVALPGSRVLAQPPPAHDRFLAQLAGAWDMTGTLLGKPVHQRGKGTWVLADGWLCFTIIDAQQPPAYQAAVYIGFDPKTGDYIAHWLDQFGAAGARVVASGQLAGHSLVLTFPYAEGAFRDTFTLEPGADSGTLLLESQSQDGSWSTFASYLLHRPHAPAARGPVR